MKYYKKITLIFRKSIVKQSLGVENFKMNKEELIRKIKITRYSRMNLFVKLEKKDKITQYINIYYSIFLVLLTSYSLLIEDPKKQKFLSISLLATSVALTILLVYISGKNYKERAINGRRHCLELWFLLDQVEKLEEEDKEGLYKYTKKYMSEVSKNENHDKEDYINYKDKDKKTVEYHFYKMLSILKIIGLFIFPVITFYIFNFKINLN